MKDYKVYDHVKADAVAKDLNPDNPLEALIMQRKTKSMQIRLKDTLWKSMRIRAGKERVSVNELVNRYLMFYCFPEVETLFRFQKYKAIRRDWYEVVKTTDNVSEPGDVQIEMKL